MPTDISVVYWDHMGDDERIAHVARVSFDKSHDVHTIEQNLRLINFLAKNNHWTPFAHNAITIEIEAPIFVARQFFKHTIGFVNNEVSRRYVDSKPSYYLPTWRMRPPKSIKQGSGTARPSKLADVCFKFHCRAAIFLYETFIRCGFAPEQARSVLPQAVMTKWVTTGSLYAWARMYKLRSESHAQEEIQQIAHAVDKILAPLFPESWKCLTGSE